MPKSNFKRRVRERQAKTGESYATAARHVRSRPARPLRLISVIERLIELADAREIAHDAHEALLHEKHGPAIPISVCFDDEGPEFEQAERTDRALVEYLKSLPPDALRKVQAVMYMGRDDDPYESLLRLLKREHHEVRAHRVCEKLPLAEYLRDGLAIVVRDGIDLDAPIPASAL